MHMLKSLLHTIGLFIVLVAVSVEAWAGPITIQIPEGGKVEINVKYKSGSTASHSDQDNSIHDENKNLGTFTFTVPREDIAKSIEIKSLGAIGGLPAFGVMDFGLAGLLSFEPIDLFAFSATDTNMILLTEIDVSSFILGGDPFSEGQVFSVTDGLVSGTDGIIFHDSSSLFSGVSSFFDIFVELDQTLIDSLPLYSGDITVEPKMEFRVPEPESFTLLIFGIMGMAFAVRIRSKTILQMHRT